MERYPQFLKFWKDNDIAEDRKRRIFRTVVGWLMAREADVDARVTISLHKDLPAVANVNRTISPINQ